MSANQNYMDTILTLNDKKRKLENDINTTIKYPKTREERDHKKNLKIELSEIKDKLKTIKKEHNEKIKTIVEQYKLDKTSLSKLPLKIKKDILKIEKLNTKILNDMFNYNTHVEKEIKELHNSKRDLKQKPKT